MNRFFCVCVVAFAMFSMSRASSEEVGISMTRAQLEQIVRTPLPDQMIKKLNQRCEQYFREYVKEMSSMSEHSSELAKSREELYRRSIIQWKNMNEHWLAWVRLRGGTGELQAPLAAAPLERALNELKRKLAEQRVLDVYLTCDAVSDDEMPPSTTLAKMLADGVEEIRRKYGNADLDNDERASGSQHDMTTLSTERSIHYINQVQRAYQARRDTVRASSASNKKELVELIARSEHSFLAYLDTCGQIVSHQEGSMWPAVAGIYMEQMMVWHLRDLDRYFPLDTRD